MSETYVPVPDLTAGRPKDKDELHLFRWLDAHCEFREGLKAEVAPIVKGYRAAFRDEHDMDLPPRSILQTLVSLGHIVAEPWVFGLFLRASDAIPEPEKPVDEQSLRGGSAAPVNPSLWAANGIPMEIPKKPEVTFIENASQPRPKFTQDATGKWIVDKAGDAK